MLVSFWTRGHVCRCTSSFNDCLKTCSNMLGITLNVLCGGAGGLPARAVLHDYELWLLPGSMDNKASRRGRDEQPSKVTSTERMIAVSLGFNTVNPRLSFQHASHLALSLPSRLN